MNDNDNLFPFLLEIGQDTYGYVDLPEVVKEESYEDWLMRLYGLSRDEAKAAVFLANLNYIAKTGDDSTLPEGYKVVKTFFGGPVGTGYGGLVQTPPGYTVFDINGKEVASYNPLKYIKYNTLDSADNFLNDLVFDGLTLGAGLANGALKGVGKASYKLGQKTAKGLDIVGKSMMPSSYNSRLIPLGTRLGLSSNAVRTATGIGDAGVLGYLASEATNNFIQNPNVANATVAGLTYIPFFKPSIELGNKVANEILSYTNAYKEFLPLIPKMIKDNGAHTTFRTILAAPKFASPKFVRLMMKSPDMVKNSSLYMWSDYGKKSWRNFLKNWEKEAAKGDIYASNYYLAPEATAEDVERFFDVGRKTFAARKKASELALLYGKTYYEKMEAITDPVLKNIAEQSPQYLDEIYEQLLKGGATEEFVLDLINRANSYRRGMSGSNLTPEDFLTFKGHSNVGKGNKSIDVEGESPSGYYGSILGYFLGLPLLEGDFSTWWSQRIPRGVNVKPGMHYVEAFLPELSSFFEGADKIAISRMFYDTYKGTKAPWQYVIYPSHQVFGGPEGATLPNFKVTLYNKPFGFNWGKGYKYGGKINNYEKKINN